MTYITYTFTGTALVCPCVGQRLCSDGSSGKRVSALTFILQKGSNKVPGTYLVRLKPSTLGWNTWSIFFILSYITAFPPFTTLSTHNHPLSLPPASPPLFPSKNRAGIPEISTEHRITNYNKARYKPSYQG